MEFARHRSVTPLGSCVACANSEAGEGDAVCEGGKLQLAVCDGVLELVPLAAGDALELLDVLVDGVGD